MPPSASEPQGFFIEPGAITRSVLFADRHLGKGDLTNGIYVDYANMIPGSGWLSVGPGYRQWFREDSLFVDASASISINSYRMAQARVELPKFLKSRLALGATARWQDFGRIDYFDVGPATSSDARSIYGIESTQLNAHATLRPLRWLDIGGQIGWMNPDTTYVEGPFLPRLTSHTEFVPAEASATIDTRDFPGHPTSGIMLRGVAARYEDRTRDQQSFDKVETEAAAFLPIAGGRAVFAVHGWYVGTVPRHGGTVPFYLQPSLGGVNTLRSYTDYRFHDNYMLVANAELRLAVMTHLDLALFADAGNVAGQRRDLDLARQSFGAGLRLHTRRETFANLDVASGDEGWRVLFRLKDPLSLARLTRKRTLVPFVP